MEDVNFFLLNKAIGVIISLHKCASWLKLISQMSDAAHDLLV